MASNQKIVNEINSNPKYKSYTRAYNNFTTTFNNFISRLTAKLNSLTTKTETFNYESGTLKLADNTVFVYSGTNGVSNLTIKYPDGDFVSTILFSTSKSGNVSINLPSDSVFVGRKNLEFFPQETWEINIHNKRIVAVQIFD